MKIMVMICHADSDDDDDLIMSRVVIEIVMEIVMDEKCAHCVCPLLTLDPSPAPEMAIYSTV